MLSRSIHLLMVLLLLIALYLGSYLAMLDPGYCEIGDGGGFVGWRWENYRWNNAFISTLYKPVHHLDQCVRPTYWHWQRPNSFPYCVDDLPPPSTSP